jgi:hypothetical protein
LLVVGSIKLADFSLQLMMHCITLRCVVTYRVEQYGALLDTMLAFEGLVFVGTAAAALQAARAHRFAAHRRWALRHIASGYGVITQRVLLGFVPLLASKQALASEDFRRLWFSVLVPIGSALNLALLELYFQVARRSSNSNSSGSSNGENITSSDKVLVSRQELQDLKSSYGDAVAEELVLISSANKAAANGRSKAD